MYFEILKKLFGISIVSLLRHTGFISILSERDVCRQTGQKILFHLKRARIHFPVEARWDTGIAVKIKGKLGRLADSGEAFL